MILTNPDSDLISLPGGSEAVELQKETQLLTYSEQGPPGPRGFKGDATVVGISTDPDNRLVIGVDGLLYVAPPQLSSSQW